MNFGLKISLKKYKIFQEITQQSDRVVKHSPYRGKYGADAPSSPKETGEALLPVLATEPGSSRQRSCRTLEERRAESPVR